MRKKTKSLNTLNSNHRQDGKVKIRWHAAVPLIQYPGSVSCPGARDPHAEKPV